MQPHGLNSPWNFPGQNTGVGSLFLLQGIFPTQELNQGAGPQTPGASVLPLGLHTCSSLLPGPDTDRDDDVDVDMDANVNVDGNIGISLGIRMPPHTTFQSLLSHYLFHAHLIFT